jgi:hypothetical protein
MAEALRFDIFAKDEFSKSFDKLKSSLPSLKTLAVSAAGGVSAIGTSLFAIAKTTASAHDEIGKFSDKIGISTEFISKMRVAAEFTGTSVSAMDKSLELLQVGLGAAQKGLGGAKDIFDDLGISVNDSSGRLKTAETILPELADKFNKMTSSSEKALAAQQLWGEEGLEMVKFLQGGSKDLKKYSEEASKMGLVVGTNAAANAAKFNDALFKLQGTLTGIKNEIGEAVIPIITGLSDSFTNFAKNNRAAIISFGETTIMMMANIAEKSAYAIGIVIDSWRGLQMMWQTLKIGLNEFAKFYVKSYDWIIEKSISLMEAINFRGVFDSSISKAKEWSSTLKAGIETLQESADTARDKLSAIANEGMATEKINDFIERSKDAIKEIKALGEAEIEEQKIKNEVFSIIQQERFDLEKDAYQMQLEELATMHDEYMLSDQEKLDKWYQDNLNKHQNNSNALIKLNQIYNKKQHDIDKKAQEDKEKIREQQKQATFTFLGNLASLGKAFGKEGFRVAQAAGIARATMNTFLAVSEAIKNSPGPPVSFAYGAAALAYGMAQVKGIASQKYAHGGLTNVPREMTITAMQGERVLSPNQNKDFTDFIKDDAGNKSNITIENMNILPNATNAEMLLELNQADWDEIVEANILPALRNLDNRGLTI